MQVYPRVRHSAFWALAAASVLLSGCGGHMNPENRTTRYGDVEGVNDSARSGTYFWKGIPFAQAPVGALRWKAPRAPLAWTGTRDAKSFGASCIQNPRLYSPGNSNTFDASVGQNLISGNTPGSEDCLSLNIWRPASGERNLPVIVFIHGGSNITGYSGDPMYDGAALANKANAVVVTANYRLGQLGHFRHPALRDTTVDPTLTADDMSGNYAVLDIVQALRFVQDNVDEFGGNPKNVTLTGQSAGAINVLAVATAPGQRAAGLFHKLAPLSGGISVANSPGFPQPANNLVGNDMIKGISGGEKRRASIAVQVLTDPRVLLLDEPTSGLDAFTASSIMEVLQGLANEGRTLILTIHQARSDLFKHFGNVLLLARGGHPVYAGVGRDMLGYFGRHGYECPKNTNPADFALDMITVDLQKEDVEAESRERVKKFIESWNAHLDPAANAQESRLSAIHEEVNEPSEKKDGQDTKTQVKILEEGESSEKRQPLLSHGKDALEPKDAFVATPRRSFNRAKLSTPAELGALVRKRTSLVQALPLLLRRAIINTRRQPELILARTMQVAGLAGVFTLFYAPFQHDYFSVQNRMGYVQQVGAFYFVGMLQNVAVYPAERDVFYREDDDGVYGVDAFLLTYTILELPFEILSCLIYGLFSTFAVRNPETVSLYFATFFGCFGVVSCGESLGIMFNTLFTHTGFAVNMMGVFLSVANGMAGVLSINMPEAFNALNYLSPIRYATRAMAPYALRGVNFHCTSEQTLPDGSCPITSGEQVLDLYNFNVDPNVNAYCLLACVVIYRLIAWALLRVTRARWKDKKRVEV